MRFTVEDAIEASEAGEPIYLSLCDIERICKRHYLSSRDFLSDAALDGQDVTKVTWDAAEVFAWLGY